MLILVKILKIKAKYEEVRVQGACEAKNAAAKGVVLLHRIVHSFPFPNGSEGRI